MTVIVLVLSGCGGGGGGGGGSAPPSPPIANATPNVSTGQAPLTVNFDATKSTDPQGYALTYAWTFGVLIAFGFVAVISVIRGCASVRMAGANEDAKEKSFVLPADGRVNLY